MREIAVRAYNKKFVDSVAGMNYYAGITSPYEYRLWDADQNSACVCDIGYSGIDCSLRECPKGDDPLTTTAATCGGRTCVDEVQSFSVDGGQTKPGTYYLIVKDYNGLTYKTGEFPLYTNNADAGWATNKASNEAVVKAALESLPNNVTGTVVVSSSSAGLGGTAAKEQYRMSITFIGKSGNVPEMTLGWTGTSNEDTRRAYVFQPGQPVQSVAVLWGTNAPASIQVTVYPQDQTLYGLSTYWSSTCTPISVAQGASGESDIADGLVSALNSVPAVKLTYGTPFIRDSNVVALAASDRYNIRIAFPDKQFGTSTLVVSGFSDAACGTALSAAFAIASPSNFGDVIDGNKEHATCSNRGLCDFNSGLCSCFSGYTGVACDVQSTLAVSTVCKCVSSGLFAARSCFVHRRMPACMPHWYFVFCAPADCRNEGMP